MTLFSARVLKKKQKRNFRLLLQRSSHILYSWETIKLKKKSFKSNGDIIKESKDFIHLKYFETRYLVKRKIQFKKSYIKNFICKFNLCWTKSGQCKMVNQLVICPKQNFDLKSFRSLSTCLDLHSTTYKNILILGNFNVGIEDQHMKSFCDNYNLTSLIKQPACYIMKRSGFLNNLLRNRTEQN